MPQIQNAILSIINGTAVDASTGISEDEKSCSVAGETIDVHSPVTLDIYDDQGRHTGPNEEGEIEYGIPNVQYDIIGTEKFAFLPDGPVYKIVNHALATGTYDMYIDHNDSDDALVQEMYFRDVPINTVNATATLVLDSNYESSGGSYQIEMDEDGDGEQESSFFGLYTFNETFVNDRTPPVTTATIDSNLVLTLTAHDDISRVEKTWYLAPGDSHWRVYTSNSAIHLHEGDTAKFFSVDYMGNIEDMKQITAPIKPVVAPPVENPPQVPAIQTPSTAPVTINYGDTISTISRMIL